MQNINQQNLVDNLGKISSIEKPMNLNTSIKSGIKELYQSHSRRRALDQEKPESSLLSRSNSRSRSKQRLKGSTLNSKISSQGSINDDPKEQNESFKISVMKKPEDHYSNNVIQESENEETQNDDQKKQNLQQFIKQVQEQQDFLKLKQDKDLKKENPNIKDQNDNQAFALSFVEQTWDRNSKKLQEDSDDEEKHETSFITSKFETSKQLNLLVPLEQVKESDELKGNRLSSQTDRQIYNSQDMIGIHQEKESFKNGIQSNDTLNMKSQDLSESFQHQERRGSLNQPTLRSIKVKQNLIENLDEVPSQDQLIEQEFEDNQEQLIQSKIINELISNSIEFIQQEFEAKIFEQIYQKLLTNLQFDILQDKTAEIESNLENQCVEKTQVKVINKITSEIIIEKLQTCEEDIVKQLNQNIIDSLTEKTVKFEIEYQLSKEIYKNEAVLGVQEKMIDSVMDQSLTQVACQDLIYERIFIQIREDIISQAILYSCNEIEERQADQLVDKILNKIIFEDINQQTLKAEKQTEDKVLESSIQLVQKIVSQEVISDIVENEKQLMYSKYLHKLTQNVEQCIIQRILHEFICLYEIDTLNKTADNVASIVQEKLFSNILDGLFETRESKFMNQEIISPKIKKTLKLKKGKTQKAQINQMKIDDLLDINFFEKCFFGRRLTYKDQLIFKIYADELLQIIKSNLAKSIVKKHRRFAESLERSRSRKRNKSKSPTPLMLGDNMSNSVYQNYSRTPQPDDRLGDRRSLPQMQDNESDYQQCLNITIMKEQDLTNNDNGVPQIDYNLSLSNVTMTQNDNTTVGTKEYNNSQQKQGPQIRIKKKKKNSVYSIPITPYTISQYDIQSMLNLNPPGLRQNVSPFTQTRGSFFSYAEPEKRQPSPQMGPNKQIKVYQNLESQIKDILKKKDVNVKQIKVRRKFDTTSQRVSPSSSQVPLVINQNSVKSIKYNKNLQNKINLQRQQIRDMQSQLPTTIIYQTQNQIIIPPQQQLTDNQSQNLDPSLLQQCPSFSNNANNRFEFTQQDLLNLQSQQQNNNRQLATALENKRQRKLSVEDGEKRNNFFNRTQTPSAQANRINQNSTALQDLDDTLKEASEIKVKRRRAGSKKHSVEKINSDYNALIAIGTPKRTVLQIIDSARKFVNYNDDLSQTAVIEKIKMPQIRYASRVKDNSKTILDKDQIEPFVNNFLATGKNKQLKLKQAAQCQPVPNSPQSSLRKLNNSQNTVNQIQINKKKHTQTFIANTTQNSPSQALMNQYEQKVQDLRFFKYRKVPEVTMHDRELLMNRKGLQQNLEIDLQ